MGQNYSIWDTYESSCNITPGTYRIIHDRTDKVLQIHEENHKTLVIRDRQQQGSDGDYVQNDHWFILRSGDGFMFKHCQQGIYISGLLLTSASAQSIHATRNPTTWTILPKKGSDILKGRCVITVPIDQNESWQRGKYAGLGVTSKGLCFVPLYGKEAYDQTWRLEHIGDATGEEDWAHRVRELEGELQAANTRWTSSESRLGEMRQQLETRETELRNIQDELRVQATELETVRSQLNRPTAEAGTQTVQLPPPPVPLEQELARLGWSFDD